MSNIIMHIHVHNKSMNRFRKMKKKKKKKERSGNTGNEHKVSIKKNIIVCSVFSDAKC